MVPEGWTKIGKDLNAGAGGQYLYLAYEEGGVLAPITNVVFLTGEGAQPQKGYWKIDTDLNAGAGGEYIYMTYSRLGSEGSPLVDVDIMVTDNPGDNPPGEWRKCDLDLNKGAGGKYIYFIYKR